MNHKEIMEAIETADTIVIEDYMDAVFKRKQELYPDWDICYFALPKETEEEKKQQDERLRALMWKHILDLFQKFEERKGQPDWEDELRAML